MSKAQVIALALMLAGSAPAGAADPANTIEDLKTTLNGCLATVRIAKGTDVTVQFSLNRRGGLIGKPRITHALWAGDEAERKASAASIAQGFDHCLPVAISDALGGAIAGRPIAYRFQGRAPDAKT